jgi:hypothetical protein
VVDRGTDVTAEEGRSDLSLKLAALPKPDGHRFEVTDLHVLYAETVTRDESCRGFESLSTTDQRT